MKKRRTILGYLTSTALAMLIPIRTPAARRFNVTEADHVIRILQEILPDNAATRRLGALALQQCGAGLEVFSVRLIAPFENTPPPTIDQLCAYLQTLRDADFANGDTVTLDGWILARSEAGAMAVAAMHREG